MSETIISRAVDIIKLNDLGTYTVPTHGLYPFQWNWDSCLTALALVYFDEDRAWTEIETLFDHQWDDGMVPHIIFHKEDDGYFPGPDVWGTGRSTPTSGITQPPVAGFAIARIFSRCKDQAKAEKRARALLHKVLAWHEWCYRCRDPKDTGLVAIIHPWETGRDNSVDWDEPFEKVPTDGVLPFVRRDTQHADPSHRPTQEQYLRYIWLVQTFKALDWDNEKLHDASPFQMVDPGFNAILLRSISEVAKLAEDLGEVEIAQKSRAQLEKGLAAMETLWDDDLGQFMCLNRITTQLSNSPSVAGLLAIFAPISVKFSQRIASRIEKIAQQTTYLVASHDPSEPEFDGKRYWRGPVWLIINYMICDGLINAGLQDLADKIEEHSLGLINTSGFAEYYDPITGEPCGGEHFTWTAAMVIEFLSSTKSAT